MAINRMVTLADEVNMLVKSAKKSNYQRQVEFRERNPGYYRKYHPKTDHEAIRLQLAAQLREAEAALAAAELEKIDFETGGINAVPEHLV